jgi:hypothetical protein
MAGPYSYVWDDFTGGWAGDVDRSKATKGQWFGQDVLVYEDGLLGPRHPLRQVTLTAPPTVDNGRVDEAILFENVVWARPTSVAIFANDDFWFIDGFANFDSAVPIDVTKTAGLRGGVMGVTLDSPNGLIYVTQAGTAPKLERINATGVVTDTAGAGTPDGEVLIRWNERMILAQRDSIFWSDAASFTSWPGANTAKVGDGAPVVALIPTPLALYIAKTSGWWVITGVLGSTAIQRQVGVNEGVEPAQIVGGAGTTTKVGARLVAAWRRGMLHLRRRANDFRSDLAAGAGPPAFAVELSELRSFSGAQTEDLAVIRASRQARLVSLGSSAAIVDCQNVPQSPTGVQHVVYVLDAQKRLTQHILPSSVTSAADQVMCPLQPMEGANGNVAGYEPDHLWLAYAGAANALQLRALRYKASRPGYGSDDPTTQVDDGSGTHPNIVGIVELPDYWHPEGRRVRVQAVLVSFRVYDNGYTGHYASTARLRCQATILGRTEQASTAVNSASSEFEWTEAVAPGSGDRDQMHRFDVNDAGDGYGCRIRLELEQVAVRRVWIMFDTGDVNR